MAGKQNGRAAQRARNRIRDQKYILSQSQYVQGMYCVQEKAEKYVLSTY